jgi:hypothetical protein
MQKTAYRYRAIHGERQFHTQTAFLNICQAARKTFDTYSYVAGGVPSGKYVSTSGRSPEPPTR